MPSKYTFTYVVAEIWFALMTAAYATFDSEAFHLPYIYDENIVRFVLSNGTDAHVAYSVHQNDPVMIIKKYPLAIFPCIIQIISFVSPKYQARLGVQLGFGAPTA